MESSSASKNVGNIGAAEKEKVSEPIHQQDKGPKRLRARNKGNKAANAQAKVFPRDGGTFKTAENPQARRPCLVD